MSVIENRSLVLLMLLGLTASLLFCPAAFAADPEFRAKEDAKADKEPTCELILRGKEVETLELDSFIPHPSETGLRRDVKSYQFSSPKGVIELPRGHYEVKTLTLKKGIKSRLRYPLETFELTPEESYELVVEGFVCEVVVERIGPFLNFDFKGPFDSQGREYRSVNGSDTDAPKPSYSISCQGKEIASGTLEYG